MKWIAIIYDYFCIKMVVFFDFKFESNIGLNFGLFLPYFFDHFYLLNTLILIKNFFRFDFFQPFIWLISDMFTLQFCASFCSHLSFISH